MEKGFEYKEEYAWLTNICLNVTDACNLACRYCFVEQHPHYMTLDVAKQAVHFILDNLEKKNKKFRTNEKAMLTYFGGEPTLMWDTIIVPLTRWIKENKFPINLNMTTNGTLLNEERLIFLKNNEIPILLSIDGDEYTQCFNRPCQNGMNSFDLINKNIPLILKYFPNTTFRATIYAPTAEKTFDNYLFAIKQGFKKVYFLPDSRHEWTNEQKEKLKMELNKIYSFISFCFSQNIIPINFDPINKSFENILKSDLKALQGELEHIETKRDVNRCGLGTKMGSVGYDGTIYGCQEQTSKDINNIFEIGNIFSGIDVQKQSQLLANFNQKKKSKCINEALCKECSMNNICYDFACPSTSYDLYQNFFIDSEIHCLWLQWIFNNSIVLMHSLVEQNNETFKLYLNQYCNYTQYFNEEGE